MGLPARRRPAKDLASDLHASRSVLTREDIAAQYSLYALRMCLRNRSVRSVLPGVYAASACYRSPDVRVAAAAAWCRGRGALSGLAALWLWGVRDRAPRIVTVQLAVPLHLERPSWLRVVRPAIELTVVPRRATATVHPADAVVQAWIESPSEAVGVVCDAVRKRVASAKDIAEAACRRPRVRARSDLKELLNLVSDGVTSFLEYLARTRVFPKHEFPELKWQAKVTAQGRRRTLDAFDRASALAIELDSRAHHSSDDDRLSDIERDAELATVGIQVVRFTYTDITQRPRWCREVYRRARSARLPASAPGRLVV